MFLYATVFFYVYWLELCHDAYTIVHEGIIKSFLAPRPVCLFDDMSASLKHIAYLQLGTKQKPASDLRLEKCCHTLALDVDRTQTK